MVNASRRVRSAWTASTASATFDPAMNLRAMRSALLRACHASTLPSSPRLGISFVPHRAHQGSSSLRLAEVLAQVAADFLGLFQIRQRIDEAEELHLEGRVVHPQAHQLVVEPRAREEHRTLPVEPGEDFAAVVFRPSVEIGRHVNGNALPFGSRPTSSLVRLLTSFIPAKIGSGSFMRRSALR